MSLMDLYQEMILDHGKNPRNFGPLDGATHTAEGFNPLCGDRVKVHLRVKDQVVEQATFEGAGCAISTASASMMTQALKGQTLAKAEELFGAFREACTTDVDEDDRLGQLNCLSGVRRFPNRIKCATLAWHAMHEALHGGQHVVKTE